MDGLRARGQFVTTTSGKERVKGEIHPDSTVTMDGLREESPYNKWSDQRNHLQVNTKNKTKHKKFNKKKNCNLINGKKG